MLQVNDLAEAMRWISGNIGMIGFDCEPDVHLMGHSSGAHISFLYLIRQAEDQEAQAQAEAAAATVAHDRNTFEVGSPKADSDSTTGDSTSSTTGGGDGDGSGGGGRLLEVEGFIGLAGVYDVHRHYLYESWRYVIRRWLSLRLSLRL